MADSRYEIGAALVQNLHRALQRAKDAGRITDVSDQVFLITDPDLVAALRFYFEKELTFMGVDVLGPREKSK